MSQKNLTPIISRIYTGRINLLDQLHTRGFDISKYAGFSVSEISILKEKKQLDMLIEGKNNEKVYVKYHVEQKALKSSQIYNYVEDLYEIEQLLEKTDQLIIIINSNVNDTIINEVQQIYNTMGYFITVFNIQQLLFNILEHVLVPEHRILSNDEKKELYKKYNIHENNQLPEISRFDPVSKVIGIRPGEVCEITRKNKTAIESKFYRFCY